MISADPNISIYHGDCLEAMKSIRDDRWELAIVDPPYFSGPEKRGYYGQTVSSKGVSRVNYPILEESWEVPGPEYFKELKRVSRHQIIWGINYFDFQPGSGRIIWDKCNEASSFSDCEIASCSQIETVRKFRFMWNGMLQGKSISEGHIMQGNKKLNEKRIHQCQKPVLLYKWLLQNFAQPGWHILDTHCGSGSIAIACHDLGYNLHAWEKNEQHYLASIKRLKEHTSQKTLFNHEATVSRIDQ